MNLREIYRSGQAGASRPSHVTVGQDAITLLQEAGLRLGYRFEESTENGDVVVRVIRPDGSVAIVARKPVPV